MAILSAVSNAQDIRPNLYLDGEALANEITLQILSGKIKLSSKRPKKIENLASYLYQGDHIPIGDIYSEGLKEKEILNWMLSRPSNSITLPEFFGKCVKAVNGDIVLALALGWNVLSQDYKNVTSRNTFKHILKLTDITGERALYDGQNHLRAIKDGAGKIIEQRPIKVMRGDNFSAWYHFFGTALSSYHYSNHEKLPYSGVLKTKAMIFAEENIFFKDHIDPLKRIEIDKAGSSFGHSLYQNLKKYKNTSEFQLSGKSKRTNYLRDEPEIYGKRWELSPGQHPADFGTDHRTLTPGHKFLLERYETVLNKAFSQSTKLEEIFEFLADPHKEIQENALMGLLSRGDLSKDFNVLMTEFTSRIDALPASGKKRSDLFFPFANIIRMRLESVGEPAIKRIMIEKVLLSIKNDLISSPDPEIKKVVAQILLHAPTLDNRPSNDVILELLGQLLEDKNQEVIEKAGQAVFVIFPRGQFWQEVDRPQEYINTMKKALEVVSAQERKDLMLAMLDGEELHFLGLIEDRLKIGDLMAWSAIKEFTARRPKAKPIRDLFIKYSHLDKAILPRNLADYCNINGKMALVNDILDKLAGNK